MLVLLAVGALVLLSALCAAVYARAVKQNMRKTTFYFGESTEIHVLPEGQFYTTTSNERG